MIERVILHEYLPNSKVGGSYEYDGQRLQPREHSDARFRGYAVHFLDQKFRRRVAVFFASDEKLFFDAGSGPREIIPSQVSATGLLWRHVRYETAAGSEALSVFTPPLRYLSNDGMFPEDVEPVIHLLRVLSRPEERERYVRKFSTGSWE